MNWVTVCAFTEVARVFKMGKLSRTRCTSLPLLEQRGAICSYCCDLAVSCLPVCSYKLAVLLVLVFSMLAHFLVRPKKKNPASQALGFYIHGRSYIMYTQSRLAGNLLGHVSGQTVFPADFAHAREMVNSLQRGQADKIIML